MKTFLKVTDVVAIDFKGGTTLNRHKSNIKRFQNFFFKERPTRTGASHRRARRDNTQNALQRRDPVQNMKLSDPGPSGLTTKTEPFRSKWNRTRCYYVGGIALPWNSPKRRKCTRYHYVRCRARSEGTSSSRRALARHPWGWSKQTAIAMTPRHPPCLQDGSVVFSIHRQERFFRVWCTRAVFQYRSLTTALQKFGKCHYDSTGSSRPVAPQG